MLKVRLGPTAVDNLKVKLAMKRSCLHGKTIYKIEEKPVPGVKDIKYKYIKDYDSLGPRVDILFPLVTPDLDFCNRLDNHGKWF